MLIGILQCGHTPDEVHAAHGDFDALFHTLLDDHDLTFRTWNVVDMDFPDDVTQADGWLVTGSRHGAYEDHAFIPPLEAFICDIAAAQKPMVGICFGHQIIAQALGGKVEKFSGGWAIGRHGYEFKGIGALKLNAWHQDQVTRRPDGARVVAFSPFCENAALVYGDTILTIQPHPEISNDVLDSYLRADRVTAPGAYPPDLLQAAAETMNMPTDADTVAADMVAMWKGEYSR